VTTTAAPSRANSRAAAAPMPELAPVMTATLSVSAGMTTSCVKEAVFLSCLHGVVWRGSDASFDAATKRRFATVMNIAYPVGEPGGFPCRFNVMALPPDAAPGSCPPFSWLLA